MEATPPHQAAHKAQVATIEMEEAVAQCTDHEPDGGTSDHSDGSAQCTTYHHKRRVTYRNSECDLSSQGGSQAR
jgi:hypothetical protein